MLLTVLSACGGQSKAPEGLNVHFLQFDEMAKKWGDRTLFAFPDGSDMLGTVA